MKNFNELVAYLKSKSSDLTQATKNLIANESLVLKNGDLYIRAQVAVGGKAELLPSGIVRRSGITNFDGNKLNDQRNHVIKAVSFGYAKDAAQGKETDLSYSVTVPPAFRNAELQISQGSRQILQIPIKSLVTGTSVKVGDDAKMLDAFALIVENEPVEIEIVFANGAAIAGADYHYVELVLSGATTSKA